MKKIISIFLFTVISFSSLSVFATGTEPEIFTSDKVTVTAAIEKMPYPSESKATLDLLTLDGGKIASSTMDISDATDKVVFTFDVPTYTIGKHFKLRIDSGLDSLLYYHNRYFPKNELTLPTYTYVAEDGKRIISTDIAVTLRPLYTKSVNISYGGKKINLSGGKLFDETAIVPVGELAKALGMTTRYDDEYNVQVVSFNGGNMYFNVDTDYTTVFGTDLFAPCKTIKENDIVYASLRTFADGIGSDIEVTDHYTHLDINITESPMLEEYFDSIPVNQWDISSRTNYMVWVSLSEYKVRLYEGSQHHWRPIHEATCAIGAPGTPSITGSYEYLYKARWDYGTYYVGPCLVFHGGYALHSVLLYQDGTEYDGRVGVQISHGCIRLKKKDIDLIANTIPVGTRIYCTR